MNRHPHPGASAAVGALILCGALAPSAPQAGETNALHALVAHHAPSLALLAREAIRVDGAGTIPISFTSAMDVLTGSNLLDRVQRAYAESLPAGQTPEFALNPAGSNTWTFVNRHGQHSEVCEVARAFAATNEIVAVYYAAGDRFFGRFESLSLIRVTPTDRGQVNYTVAVFAYPHQPLCRFVVRHLNLLERFFREKTKELESVSARVCGRLCAPTRG
jgi:hypothetical protein